MCVGVGLHLVLIGLCWYWVMDVFWVFGWLGVDGSVAGTVWWMCSGWWIGLVLIGLVLVLGGGCVLGGGLVWC